MCRHLPSVMPFPSHTHPCEKPPPLQMRKLRLMLCPRSQLSKNVPTTLYEGTSSSQQRLVQGKEGIIPSMLPLGKTRPEQAVA